MKKKINEQNFKTLLINNKNPFKIIQAISNSDSISIFFNESQYVTVRCKTDNCYEYEFLENTKEDSANQNIKNKNIRDKKETKKFLCSSTLMFYPYLIITFYRIFAIKQYRLSVSILISCLVFSIMMLLVEIIGINSTISYDTKLLSNHSAEHKIVNFIKKYHRIPNTLDELKHSSRVSRDCGTCEFVNINYIDFLSSTLVFSIIGNFIVFIMEFFNYSINVFSFVLLFFILFIVYCRLLIFKVKFTIMCVALVLLVSIIVQLTKTTTKKVSKQSLVSAYIAGSIWMAKVHPDNINIDGFYNLLDSIGVSDVHEITDQL